MGVYCHSVSMKEFMSLGAFFSGSVFFLLFDFQFFKVKINFFLLKGRPFLLADNERAIAVKKNGNDYVF